MIDKLYADWLFPGNRLNRAKSKELEKRKSFLTMKCRWALAWTHLIILVLTNV